MTTSYTEAQLNKLTKAQLIQIILQAQATTIPGQTTQAVADDTEDESVLLQNTDYHPRPGTVQRDRLTVEEAINSYKFKTQKPRRMDYYTKYWASLGYQPTDDLLAEYRKGPGHLIQKIKDAKTKKNQSFKDSTITQKIANMDNFLQSTMLGDILTKDEMTDFKTEYLRNKGIQQAEAQLKTKESIKPIMQTLAEVEQKYGQDSPQALLVFLYSVCPLRDNYGRVIIKKQAYSREAVAELPEEVNALYITPDMATFYIRHYKMVDKRGPIVANIMGAIERLNHYIRTRGLQDGDYLFNNGRDTTRPMYKSFELGSHFAKKFLTDTGEHGPINYLRHAGITYLLSKPEALDPKYITELALISGHSVDMLFKYVKEGGELDLDDSEY